MSEQDKISAELLTALHSELSALLQGGGAHVTFDAAVADFPPEFRGVVPDALPYSAWQIVEHIRIAQEDMLDFSRNADSSYKEKSWPEDYWPKSPEPPSEKAWDDSIGAIDADREAFRKLVHDADAAQLATPFPWGDGQTLLKEALQVADHNAYHVGELIVLRRVLGIWIK